MVKLSTVGTTILATIATVSAAAINPTYTNTNTTMTMTSTSTNPEIETEDAPIFALAAPYQCESVHGKNLFHAEHMPSCTCGDWTSSSTRAFLERTGHRPYDIYPATQENREYMLQACPQTLKTLGPLTQQLAHCALGVSWPEEKRLKNVPHAFGYPTSEEHRKMYQLGFGEDPFCDALRAEVNGWIEKEGVTEMQANFKFCSGQSRFKDKMKAGRVDMVQAYAPYEGVGKTGLKAHESWITLPSYLCDSWMKKHNFYPGMPLDKAW